MTKIASVFLVIEALWRDLRFSVRSLSKSIAVAAAVVVTLAIGIGATTVIFSIVNGVLLKPLGYPDAERLIVLSYVAPNLRSTDLPSAPFLYFTFREQAETFDASGLWANRPAAATGLDEPERVQAINLTADVLPLLGIEPVLGRVFTAEDDLPQAPLTTVLTYGYWQRHFGGDRSAIGQHLTLDGQAHEIIGVMPEGFGFLDQDVELFRPLQFDRARTTLGNFSFHGIARLKPDVTLERASADAARLIPLAIDSFPPFPGSTAEMFRSAGIAPNFRSLKSEVVGDIGGMLWVLMGTIGIVLLIACANVANLFLIRTEGRRRELAVRAALGAGRPELTRALLIESLLLGSVGGLAGLALAYGGLEFVLTRGPQDLPRIEEISIDGTVLAFVAIIAPLTGLLFGTMPALRCSSPRLSRALGTAGRGVNETKEARRARGALVVVQVALALVLMMGAGLMLRTYQALSNVDPGFSDADTVQVVRINVPEIEVPDPEEAARVMNQIVDRVAAIPGVDSAAFGSSVPLEDFQVGEILYLEGTDYEPDQLPPPRRLKFVSPGFIAAVGTPLIAGRDFDWTDMYDRRLVAMVSESVAAEQWGSAAAALGKHVRVSRDDPWREIVGVIGDVRDEGLSQPAPPTAYFPALRREFWGMPTTLWRPVALAIRTPRAGTEAFVSELRTAIWSVNRNLPLANVRTLGDLYEQSFARTSFTLVLLGVAGAMALLLSLVGLYGVISYAVSQRSREIGIRLALGATPGGVQAHFTRQALGLVAVGSSIGLVAASGMTRLMESLLFGVAPFDPWTFVVVPGLLLLIAALATRLPARRALRVDPIEALRHD